MGDEPERRPSPRVRRWLLIGMVLCAAASFAPFDLEPPSRVHNRVERLADGSLLFAWEGRAEIPGPLPWLVGAAATSRLEVDLRARTTEVEQHGPARVLAIADDHQHANLVVGQEGSDLVVRVRRPDADESGEPPYVVRDVFEDLEWHDIGLRVTEGELVMMVDGRVAVSDRLGEEGLRAWDPSYPLTLGNEATGRRAWSGQLQRVEAGIPGATVDLLASGELETPESWWRYRTPALAPAIGGSGFEDALVHVLLFGPLGAMLFVVTEPRRDRAAIIAVAFCVTIEAGQLIFAGRHSSYADLAINLVSVGVGWAAGSRCMQARGGRDS